MSWSRFFRRNRWDDERARELEAHLAIETDENIARGMSRAEARDAARRKLGNVTQIREEIYRMNTIGLLDTDLAGSALRRAAAAAEPGLRAGRHPLAGARRRRQHRHLPAAQRAPAAHAARPARRAARRDQDRRRRWPFRLDGRPRDSHQRLVGAHPRPAGGVLERVRLGNAEFRAERRRREPQGAGAVGERRLLHDARGGARARPRVHRRRRSPRLPGASRGHQLRVLAA